MPLPGGAAAKYGDRYEGKWTAYCLAQVMAESILEIRLEDPGIEGEGCEFWLKKKEHTRKGTLKYHEITEYHQVKRQHATPRAWTMSELKKEGVLQTAYEKTRDTDSRFIFVSTLSSSELAELVGASRDANSLAEFRELFVSGKFKQDAWKALVKAWKPLVCEELNLDPGEDSSNESTARIAYERLQRIECHPISEVLLEKLVDSMLGSLVRGVSPDTFRAEFVAYALEHVHAALDVAALWQWAEEKGYGRTDYAKDATVLAALEQQNRRCAKMIEPIAGTITLPREEARRAFEILTGDEAKDSVLVSGGAGIGKSGILAQTIEMLANEKVSYLYFRVDDLNPTLLPKNVGEQLGLPGSPAEVLANVARYKPSVLIIDQLDDVSTASSRNPQFFGCIREIVQQAVGLPGVRLLLACRRFDLQKDNRLRALVSDTGPAQELEASLLDVHAVREVLGRLGQDCSSFDADQIELLRVPLHLSMLAQVAEANPTRAPTFTSKVDLFAAFWEEKLRRVAERLDGRTCQWAEVIDRLCERMTEESSLFVDEAILDDYYATPRAMLSERVLISEGGRIRFFHAAFFDYAFARRFVSKNKDLLDYVLEGEQALFKRPVLRQIVIYWVEKDSARFADAIRDLLLSPKVRFHLKHCVLDAIEQADTASMPLWAVFGEVLDGEDSDLSRAVENLLVASGAWFSFLTNEGHLSTWHSSPEPSMRNRGRRCVIQQIEAFPNECAGLLAPHIGESPEWDGWILRILGGRALARSRGLFDIFLSLVNLDAIGVGATPDFWTYLYALHEQEPAWAAEAIACYLERRFETLTSEELEEQVLDKSVHGDELIAGIATDAPHEFLDGILPVFLKIVEQYAEPRGEGLRKDSVWEYRNYDSPMDVKDALLSGLENALRQVAKDDPAAFQHCFDKLATYGDYDSVNFLLMRAFAVVDVTCVDQAVAYMLEMPERLECGWVFAAAHTECAQYWAAREAVLDVTTLCSDMQFQQLEKTMLDYYPTWERSKAGHRAHGRWQLIMLTALGPNRRNQATDARINELRRKFPDAKIAAPIPAPMLLEAVQSPIPDDATQKMSDENWLRAISVYDQDRDHWGKDHRLRGGAVELSRQLETATKDAPERFARLARSFTSDTNPYYFNAVLRGLRETDVAGATVFDVVRYFFSLPAIPGARWMSHAIVKYSAEDIPEDILGIVGWLATEAADPATDDEAETWSQSSAEEERPANYLNRAINTTRGSAAEDIGYLLHADAGRVPFFMPHFEQMVADPTATVRSTVAHALCGLFAHEEELAIDLFLKLCEIENDLLLATPHVYRFLYHGNILHFAQLRAIMQRMLDSPIAAVREAGALHACLAQFSAPEATDLAVACVTGDEAQRKGAASVAQANVFTAKCRHFCEAALASFFNDPSEDVRDSASRCFIRAKGQDLEGAQGLIRAFLGSKSFPKHGEFLIMGLKDSTADLNAVIIEVCEAVLSALEESSTVPYGRLYFEARDLADLVFRAYAQSDDQDYRSRCLDMIDGFVATQAYGIAKQLAEYER